MKKYLRIATMFVVALALSFSLKFHNVSAAYVKADDTTYIFTSGGKEVYQWGLYNKNRAKGSMRNREQDKNGIYLDGAMGVDSITNITNSNPSVCSTKISSTAWEDETFVTLSLKFKKAGSTTIRYTIKDLETGKVTNVTKNIKAYKYACPVKKITIGGKNFTKKVKNSPFGVCKQTFSGKLKVTPAKGWTVKRKTLIKNAYSSEFISNPAIKANTKIKKNSGVVEVCLYNKSQKRYMSIFIGVTAPKSFQVFAG